MPPVQGYNEYIVQHRMNSHLLSLSVCNLTMIQPTTIKFVIVVWEIATEKWELVYLLTETSAEVTMRPRNELTN